VQKILVIIQRSNGDVFLSSPLINKLKETYPNSSIDILINDDTLAIAKTLKNVDNFILYSYNWRKEGKAYKKQKERELRDSIKNRYDLAINLTASDRSVLYAILAGKKSISAIESSGIKSWWKKIFLSKYYYFDVSKSIVLNNITPLKLLDIEIDNIQVDANYKDSAKDEVESLLQKDNINQFLIFHPSAQYEYKVYPKHLRDELLSELNTLNIPIIVTGGKTKIDEKISDELPNLDNVYNYIGKTSLDGYIALCDKSIGYIGMDTLNMHIASALNKRVFGIFGPTFLSMWSPWENRLQQNISTNAPIQSYGNITLFQADMECVACGKAGCDDKHGKSECMYNISPKEISNEVSKWLKSL
jgi:heptosyltransferase-3